MAPTRYLPLYSELTVADLTASDVDALAAFAETRVRAVMATSDSDTDEWRAGLSLIGVLTRQVNDARTAFGRGGEPATAQARRRQWNALATIALPWADCPGYDSTRWNRVHYLDADEVARAAELHRSLL